MKKELKMRKFKLKCKLCAVCCIYTEMEISNKEIKQIEKLGYSKIDFIDIDRGYKYLKNINGRCFFLTDNNKCKIYTNRPTGCRYYPIILNENKCVIDRDCSCYIENQKIEIPNNICKKLKQYIRTLDEEIRNQIDNI